MCGRYHLRAEEREVQEIGEILRTRTPELPENAALSGDICPGMQAPALCRSRSGVPAYFLMHWGFRLNSRLVINARSESSAAKPLFALSLQIRRCLIPASLYYEWGPEKGQPYQFDARDRHLLFLAGLYRLDTDGPSFVILTREAIPDFAGVHPRMPLILPPQDHALWLTPGADPAPLLLAGDTDLAMHAPIQKATQLRLF